MTIMTDAIRTFKLLGCELLFCTNALAHCALKWGPAVWSH